MIKKICTSIIFILSVSVLFGQNMSMYINSNYTICHGESQVLTVQVTGGVAPYSYLWAPTLETTQSITVSPTETTSYYILITDADNDTVSKTVTVHVVHCGSYTDTRDGNTYRTVIIGEQEWMAENLRYLPSVNSSQTGSEIEPYLYVYGYNGTDINAAKESANYQTYGVLYNWHAATAACPDGWRLPFEYDWTDLFYYIDYEQDQNTIAQTLKSTSGWDAAIGNGSNEIGFNALPGGLTALPSGNNRLTENAFFWTNSPGLNNSSVFVTIDSVSNIQNTGRNFGHSVRCMRNTLELIDVIPDHTIQINTPSERFEFSDYFRYSGVNTVHYDVYVYSYDETDDMLRVVQNESSFGFIGLQEGVAYVSISAWEEHDYYNMTLKSYVHFEFEVTVESSIIRECEPFTITPTISDVTCNEGTNGGISINVSGGTPPYSYRWSNTRTDNRITRVPAGYYSVTVMDSLLCITREYFYIDQPIGISIYESNILPVCGELDGQITVSATGGTAPYSYLWNTGETSQTLSDIEAGIYTVTVTDDAGCIARRTIELQNANAPSIFVMDITPSTCNPNNGAIEISVTGGTEPYTFEWNDNIDSQNRTGLAAGKYSVRVGDDVGCFATRTIEVPAKSILQPEIALVTYSMMTGNNLVVWLREQTDAIDFYSIYKEIDGSGNFELIDIQRYDTISVFEDTRTNPLEESARYRISATDYCGNESHMSAALAEYKTMNLVLEITEPSFNLSWDAYEGSDYYRYLVYARNRNGVWTQIGVTPATALQYSVANNGTYTAFYVAVELQRQIAPLSEYLKAESGPFTLAMSNIAEAETETLIAEIKTSESIQIYPSVVSDKISVVIPQQYASARISITTVLGKEVLAITSKKSEIEIPVETLANGTYIVTVTTHTVQKSVVVVKK